MASLYIMVGASGAGKSYFVKRMRERGIKPFVYISRDEIRFSLLKEGEDYFSHEKEVVKEFAARINLALAEGKDVVADQTSLTRVARKRLLKSLHGFSEVIFIVLRPSLEEHFSHNEARTGLAHVSKKVIKQQYERFEDVSKEEMNNIVDKYKCDVLKCKGENSETVAAEEYVACE